MRMGIGYKLYVVNTLVRGNTKLGEIMKFTVRKILGSNVETKDFNRIVSEISKILDSTIDLRLIKEEAINIIIDMHNDFRVLEQNYIKYCKLEKNIYDKIINQLEHEIEFNSLEYDDPNYLLREYFENFLIRSERIKRYKMKLCKLFFDDEKMEEGKYRRKKIAELIEKNRNIWSKGLSDYYTKLLNYDKNWLSSLTEVRGRVEHVENIPLELTNYNFILENNITSLKHQHLLPYNVKVNWYMNNIFKNLYTHMEDFIVLLLNFKTVPLFITYIDTEENKKENINNDWYSIDIGERVFKTDLLKIKFTI